MNGARALVRTLVDAGVDVCFANPGTSEMYVVVAIDDVPEMRGVLTLFEGVATGAADGYARMAGRPAATLLHLGPGLSDGLANLHNARRGRTPLVNVVGDHARSHKRLDPPLESDIDALAGTVSGWVRRSLKPADVAADAAEAVAAALAGAIAPLIVPSHVSWEDGAAPAVPAAVRPTPQVPSSLIEEAAAALRAGEPTVLFLGGDVMVGEDGLLTAARIAAGTGARLMSETFPPRTTRGAGLPGLDRLPYPPDMAIKALSRTRHLILVGATVPVHFFAYPDKPGTPVPEDCTVHALSRPDEDGVAALRALADLVAPDAKPDLLEASRPELPSGPLDPRTMSQVIGALLPENAIVVDEALTSGVGLYELTSGGPRHDWLSLTGGGGGGGAPPAPGAAGAPPPPPGRGGAGGRRAPYHTPSPW